MRFRRSGGVLLLAWLIAAVPAGAVTDRDLGLRMVSDGFTQDFTPDEAVFGSNPAGGAQEPTNDSRWGVNNDVHQIRITWDHRFLYVAVEGIVWDNNMLLWLDTVEGVGLESMVDLNSWRRNVRFIPAFAPDLFVGTWDRNATGPRLLLHDAGIVTQLTVASGLFAGASTFDQAAAGRSMELRIPWSVVFRGEARDSVIDLGEDRDTVAVLPPCAVLELATMVTTAGDGFGGPDSAPNNSSGHSSNASELVIIDNFAIVPLDVDCDRLADTGVAPRDRVRLHDVTTPVARSTWGRLRTRFR